MDCGAKYGILFLSEDMFNSCREFNRECLPDSPAGSDEVLGWDSSKELVGSECSVGKAFFKRGLVFHLDRGVFSLHLLSMILGIGSKENEVVNERNENWVGEMVRWERSEYGNQVLVAHDSNLSDGSERVLAEELDDSLATLHILLQENFHCRW